MSTKPFHHRLNRLIFKAAVLMLSLSICMAALPGAALAAVEADVKCASKYTVKGSDSLAKIASHFKVDWEDLVAANDLESPYTLYAGMKLCIPKKSTPDPSSRAPGRMAASFTVSAYDKGIMITTSHFPTRSSFYVRVDDASTRGYQWFRVGMLLTRKSGEVTRQIRLPKDLRSWAKITVCLKNATTDALICTPFKRP